MRWAFFYPASKLQLIDWETAPAPPMLAEMRAAIARGPTTSACPAWYGNSCRSTSAPATCGTPSPPCTCTPTGIGASSTCPSSRAHAWWRSSR